MSPARNPGDVPQHNKKASRWIRSEKYLASAVVGIALLLIFTYSGFAFNDWGLVAAF